MMPTECLAAHGSRVYRERWNQSQPPLKKGKGHCLLFPLQFAFPTAGLAHDSRGDRYR